MKFYLGSHNPSWLWDAEKSIDLPLFISHSTLKHRKTFKPARFPWALDSGGFSELKAHGKWTVSVEEFIDKTRRYKEEIGNLDFAAPMDWMCEPEQLEKTGLSIREHQRRTTENYLELKHKAPDIPWIPVIQGWFPEDYYRHRDMYRFVGVKLEDEKTVGIGTVCRRQATTMAHDVIQMLQPIRLHGFGIKITGLKAVGHLLSSSDSMAWSFGARVSKILLPECQELLRDNPKSHKNCANCHRYAVKWYHQVLNAIGADPCSQSIMNLSSTLDSKLFEIAKGFEESKYDEIWLKSQLDSIDINECSELIEKDWIPLMRINKNEKKRE